MLQGVCHFDPDAAGVSATHGRSPDHPRNYLAPVVPFGYRRVGGKLSVHPAELKICRLIVELIDRRGMNRLAANRYLTEQGIKNRQGIDNRTAVMSQEVIDLGTPTGEGSRS